MAKLFQITRPDGMSTVKLDSQGRATVQYTVKNISARPIDGRAVLISVQPRPPDGVAEKRWAQIEGKTDRHFDQDREECFTVKVAAPPNASAGTYTFRLDTVWVDKTDEGDQGQPVGFTVTAIELKPARMHWLIPAIVVVVLAVGGTITWLLMRSRPTPIQVAATSTQATPQIPAQTLPAPPPIPPVIVKEQNFKQVFSGGSDIIYGISTDGTLKWYKHRGSRDGDGTSTPGAWEGPKDVGTGWQNFKQVFSGCDGIIYAIAYDGRLKWYRHNGFRTGDGLNVAGAWDGPKDVGTGWAEPKEVFSGCGGIIYTLASNGTLNWYYHKGFQVGTFDWKDPAVVDRGWQNFAQVFSGCDGVIYGIANDGTLKWYRHNGFRTGDGGSWDGPKDVYAGWKVSYFPSH
jgi:hypothetical protein